MHVCTAVCTCYAHTPHTYTHTQHTHHTSRVCLCLFRSLCMHLLRLCQREPLCARDFSGQCWPESKTGRTTWARTWASPQPPLRTGALIRTLKPLISHTCKTLPNTPWQAFKMALVVPSFNTPLRTSCSPPPPLTKESSSVGRALALHRLAPRWLHP